MERLGDGFVSEILGPSGFVRLFVERREMGWLSKVFSPKYRKWVDHRGYLSDEPQEGMDYIERLARAVVGSPNVATGWDKYGSHAER